MNKRFLVSLALGVASAFLLAAAAPAWACGKDCDCNHDGHQAKKAGKKTDAKPAEKAPAAGEKKTDLGAAAQGALLAADEKKCECEKGGKGCTCKKGECKCAHCGADKAKSS